MKTMKFYAGYVTTNENGKIQFTEIELNDNIKTIEDLTNWYCEREEVKRCVEDMKIFYKEVKACLREGNGICYGYPNIEIGAYEE